MPVDFYNLLELAQIKAIGVAIEPTIDSIWRIRCREYSEIFHTPLHVVQNELDPEFVLQALNEHQYSPKMAEEELEDLLDILYRIRDPEYAEMTQKEVEDLVDSVINKEIRRTSKNKISTEGSKANKIVDKNKSIQKPKNGSVKFSELEKIDSIAEEKTSGFKD